MRKTLLSMALIAASGTYVGYEDFVAPTPPAATLRADTSAKAANAPITATLSATTVGATAFTAVSTGTTAFESDPAAPSRADSSVTANPDVSIPTTSLAALAALPRPLEVSPQIAAASPVPLPRLRPTESPAAEVTNAATPPAARYHDGTFKGTDTSAYYGHVQVEVVIKGGQVTAVNVLDYPSDRRTSRYINSQALPVLEQEAVQAQSANIDAVSGATLTSEAFVQSLDAALAAATGGGSNA